MKRQEENNTLSQGQRLRKAVATPGVAERPGLLRLKALEKT